jgi:cyclomaltodextrinase / maltogenic alpha-amylase / neopullulanase
VLALLLTGTLAHAALGGNLLRFDSRGGDAWTFSKLISGTVPQDRCDAVVVRSSRGRVSAPVTEGRFAATVPLVQGHNSISAQCLRQGRPVGDAVPQAWTVRLLDVPSARAVVTVTGDLVSVDASGSKPAPGIASPIVHYRWEAAVTNPGHLELQAVGSQRVVRPRPPRIDGHYRVSLTVTDALGRTDTSMVMFRVVSAHPQAIDELHDHPDWRSCTVLYGVAPALFGSGSGGLASITRYLGQISHLGATAVWLSPVTDAPPGDFGYAVTDPFRVRRDLGSDADLQALIVQAHRLGLRVLLDFVTNHLAKESRYFSDAARFGARSPYFNWFEWDREGRPAHYFDWVSLENLNYGNPEVRNYILAALAHWVRKFSIDGFRADAAWAVRQREPSFWPRVRREVERIRPNTLLLAEASARDPYYTSDGFDAAYDWTGELGHWSWAGVFGPPGELPDLRLLRDRLTNEGRGWTDSSGILRFLNNNDTGQRFLSVHGLAVTRLAAALLFTVPGIPLIYAGDEVGAAFEPYQHPAPIQWSDPDHLTALYRRLIRVRREIPALRSPTLHLLLTSRENSVLAYTREAALPDEAVTVALNFGESSFSLPLDSVAGWSKASSNLWWAENILDGTRTIVPADAQAVRVAPHSAVLVRRAGSEKATACRG